MLASDRRLKATMEVMIAKEIKRLLAAADCCVFVVYDPAQAVMEPLDYICHERQSNKPIQMDVALDFEGIGVWYLVFREGDIFKASKIMLHMEGGDFKHGQMGKFKGCWKDFPRYVLEDRWVQEQLNCEVSNDPVAVANVETGQQTYASSIDGLASENSPRSDLVDALAEDFPAFSKNDWFEPPEEKQPEPSLFVLDDQESKDLIELYEQGLIEVEEFPDQPFGRFAKPEDTVS